MSLVTPNVTSRSWRPQGKLAAVRLCLSDRSGNMGEFVGETVAGFTLEVSPVDVDTAIEPSSLTGAAAAVVEVAADDERSVLRFLQLAETTAMPLVAAIYNPPLALVRKLIRAGAHDVIPLPLDLTELETSLEVLRDRLAEQQKSTAVAAGKTVTMIKSAGGVGATSMLGQLAIRSAEQQSAFRREVCLIDLDVQFGDAAFQLGLQPSLTVAELFAAGTRLDGELLRSVATIHASGLNVIAAPADMMPLEAVSSDQVLQIVELATRQFGLVFIDLPSNWTNWSLSVLARSDVAMLATELTVPGLNRARRQMQLLRSQDLVDVEIKVVANRYEKALLKNIRAADVRQALGNDIAFTVANDPQTMRPAIDRGVPIAEIKKRTALGRDIDTLASGLTAHLGLER